MPAIYEPGRWLHPHPPFSSLFLFSLWAYLTAKITSENSSKNGLQVLPLFGNATARQLFIDFTPFFRQIGQFLNFRNEIYKTWGFQQCIAWSTKVAKNMSTCCLLHETALPKARRWSEFALQSPKFARTYGPFSKPSTTKKDLLYHSKSFSVLWKKNWHKWSVEWLDRV